MDSIKKTRISFVSGNTVCIGYLFLPKSPTGRLPCIVMGHGFTGTQDRLKGSAERFASEGIAALTFDYRNFGESGGELRQVIHINDQLQDFHNAVAFARAQAEIDPGRIGLWGSSLGGGHVISVAAKDPKIAAVVSQVPFNGFPKKVEGRSLKATVRLLAAMIWDGFCGLFGLKPFYIKAVGMPGELAVMASAQAQKTIDAMQSDQWQNKVAPRALLEMMRYKPGLVASKITVPVLVCVGELDVETLGDNTRQLATGPKAVLKTYPVAHFDFYRPDIRQVVLDDQARFFKDALQQ